MRIPQIARSFGLVFSVLFLMFSTMFSAALWAQSAPQIGSIYPLNPTVTSGGAIILSVTATGSPTPTVSWLYQPAGTTGFNPFTAVLPTQSGGLSTLDLSGVGTIANGDEFEAVAGATAGGPSATSLPVTLTVYSKPGIGAISPTLPAVVAGGSLSLSVTATGFPAPAISWLYQPAGTTGFVAFTAATATQVGLTSTLPLNGVGSIATGDEFEAVAASNTYGPSVTSAPVTLTVYTAPGIGAITPPSPSVLAGGNTSLSVSATGFPTPTITWYYEPAGATSFSPFTAGTVSQPGMTSTLSLTGVGATASGTKFEAVASNGYGSNATSSPVTLTVNVVPSGIGPVSLIPSTITAGGSTTLSATATGSPTPSIYWLYQPGGTTGFVPFEAVNPVVNGATSTLNLSNVGAVANGDQFEAVAASNGTGIPIATSAPVTLTVDSATGLGTLTVTPSTITAGQGTVLSVTATGYPVPAITWYYQPAGTTGFVPFTAVAPTVSGATSTLTLANVGANYNGDQFQAVASANGFGPSVTSNTVTLTVDSAPGIATPTLTPQTITAGNGTVLSATATGYPVPTITWMYEPAGGTKFVPFTAINTPGQVGATSTLNLNGVGAVANGDQFEAVAGATSSGPSVTSAPVTLTVDSAPGINTPTLTPASITAGSNTVLSATATGYPVPVISWLYEPKGGTKFVPFTAISTPGQVGATSTLNLNGVGAVANGDQFEAVATYNGVSATSAPVTLTVNSAPGFSVNPTAQSITAKTATPPAVFTATATGYPVPTITWWYKPAGATSFSAFGLMPTVNGATSTLTLSNVGAVANGDQFEAQASNGIGSTAISTAALLTVSKNPNGTVSFTNTEQTYTGSALAPTPVTAPVSGMTVSLAYTQGGSPATPIAAGTYQVTGTISNTDYTGSGTGSFKIDQAVPTVSINNIPTTTQVYAGTYTPTFAYNGDTTGTITAITQTPSVCTVSGGLVTYVGAGTCTLEASAPVGTNYTAATSPSPYQSFTVIKATPTITSVLANLSTSATTTYGNLVTLTATIAGVTNGNTPTGSISFYDNGTLLGSGTLTAGTASYPTYSLTGGNHTITVSYSSDADYFAVPVSSTPSAAVTVLKVTPTVAVTGSGTTYGSASPFTAIVTGVSGQAFPTGLVTFYDGSSVVNLPLPATATSLGNGQWSLTIAMQTVGTHTIYAAYGGDINYNAVTFLNSTGKEVVAAQAPTTLAVAKTSPAASSVVYGTAVTFTATVPAATYGVTPTGTVTFYNNGTAVGSAQALVASGGAGSSGVATISLSRLAVSTTPHAITASYNGDDNYLPQATSTGTASVTVSSPATVVAFVTAPASPITYGTTLGPLSASATDTSVTPNVNISTQGTFSYTVIAGNAACAYNTGTAVSSSTVLAPTNPTATGYQLEASFTPTGSNYSSGVACQSLTVNTATPTASIVSNASQGTAAFGSSVTFTATLTGISGGAIPTNNVTFYNNGAAIASCPSVALTNGTATCSTSTLTSGSHTITVSYAGDTNYSAITTSLPSVSLTIGGAAPTVAVTSTTGSSVSYGTAVSFTATLTGSNATPPAGTVTFYDDGNAIAGPMALVAGSGATSSVGSGTISDLTPGVHTIYAAYAPSATYLSVPFGNSAPFTLTVSPVAPASVAVTGTAATSTYGTAVIFTAKVAEVTNGVSPTGSVSFFDCPVSTASCTQIGGAQALTAGATFGSASVTLSKLAAEAVTTSPNHVIYASYSGDSNYSAEAVTFTNATGASLTVSQAPTTVTMGLLENSSIAYGSSVGILSASAASGSTNVSTLGSFSYYAGATCGAASPTSITTGYSSLPVGAYQIWAAFTGTSPSNYAAGTASACDTLTVTKGTPTVSVVTSATGNNASYGATVAFTATVVGGSGTFNSLDTVNFTENGTSLTGCGNVTLVSGSATCNSATLAVGLHTVTATFNAETNYNSATGATAVTITPATPAIASFTMTGINHGATVTLPTPAVTNPNNSATVSGSLSFSAQTATGSPIALTSATILPVGTYTVLATFTPSNTTNYNTATQTSSLTVSAIAASVTNVTATGAGTYGSLESFSATLPSDATIGSTVTFTAEPVGSSVNPISLCTAMVSGITSKTATCTSTALPASPTVGYTITATFNGDANYTTGTGTSSTLLIAKATPVMGLISGNASSTYGQTVTFTATLPSDAAGTDTVAFTANNGGGTLCGAAAINSTNVKTATCSFSTLAASATAYTVTATLNGDSNYSNGTATVGQTVSAVTPVVSMAALASATIPYGTPLGVLAANATNPNNAASINSLGAFTYYEGASCAPGTSGTAVTSASQLTPNTYYIWASFLPTAGTNQTNYGSTATVSSACQFLTVTLATPTLAVTSSAPTVSYGATVNLTATLSEITVNTVQLETGTVTFFDNGKQIGSPVAVTQGAGATATAVASGVTLTAGSHIISASLAGDTVYTAVPASASVVANVTVSTDTPTLAFYLSSTASPTVTAVSPITYPATLGAALTNYSTATNANSTLAVSGTWSYSAVPTAGSAIPLTATTVLPAGSYSVVATFTPTDAVDYATATASASLTVSKAATTTTMTATPASTYFGRVVTFSATVSASPSNSAAIPSGTVVFSATGYANICAATVSSAGTASCTSSVLAVNNYTDVKATYNGDTNYTGSVSSNNTLTIAQADTVTVTAASINYGSLYSPTTTVTLNGTPYTVASPSGWGQFGVVSYLATPTTGGGSAIEIDPTTIVPVGTYNVVATFTPTNSSLYSAVSSAAVTLTVAQAAPAVALSSTLSSVTPGSPNQTVPATYFRSTYAVPVTYTATVPNDVSTSGTVAFTATPITNPSTAGTPIVTLCAKAPVTSTTVSGVTTTTATCVYSTLTVNAESDLNFATSWTVNASYNGDANYTTGALVPANAQIAPIEVGKGTPTVSVGVAPATTLYLFNSVTLTATVPSDYTGAVSIVDASNGNAILCSTASCQVSSLITGAHNIEAILAGDNNYNGATSAPVILTILEKAPAVTLAATSGVAGTNPNYATTYGTSVTFTATVPTDASPASTVTFSAGSIPLCTVTVGATPTAVVCTMPTLTLPGSTIPYIVSATFNGDINYSPATATVQLTVGQAAPTVTVTSTVTSTSVAPQPYGTAFPLTATVLGTGTTAAGDQVPTGTVTFWDTVNLGTPRQLGTVQILAPSASAPCSTTVPCAIAHYTATLWAKSTEEHVITATYSGDTNYDNPSVAGSLDEWVSGVAITVTPASASANYSASTTNNVNLSATVSYALDPPISQGTVTFAVCNNATPTNQIIGQPISVPVANGVASTAYNLGVASAGNYYILATYAGNGNYTSAATGTIGMTSCTPGNSTTAPLTVYAATTDILPLSVNPASGSNPLTGTNDPVIDGSPLPIPSVAPTGGINVYYSSLGYPNDEEPLLGAEVTSNGAVAVGGVQGVTEGNVQFVLFNNLRIQTVVANPAYPDPYFLGEQVGQAVSTAVPTTPGIFEATYSLGNLNVTPFVTDPETETTSYNSPYCIQATYTDPLIGPTPDPTHGNFAGSIYNNVTGVGSPQTQAQCIAVNILAAPTNTNAWLDAASSPLYYNSADQHITLDAAVNENGFLFPDAYGSAYGVPAHGSITFNLVDWVGNVVNAAGNTSNTVTINSNGTASLSWDLGTTPAPHGGEYFIQATYNQPGSVIANYTPPSPVTPADYQNSTNVTCGVGNSLTEGTCEGQPITILPDPTTVTPASPAAIAYDERSQNVTLTATVANTLHAGELPTGGYVYFTVSTDSTDSVPADVVGTGSGLVSAGAVSATVPLTAGLAPGVNYYIFASYVDTYNSTLYTSGYHGNNDYANSVYPTSGPSIYQVTIIPATTTITPISPSACTYGTNCNSVTLSAKLYDTSFPPAGLYTGDSVTEGEVTFNVRGGSYSCYMSTTQYNGAPATETPLCTIGTLTNGYLPVSVTEDLSDLNVIPGSPYAITVNFTDGGGAASLFANSSYVATDVTLTINPEPTTTALTTASKHDNSHDVTYPDDNGSAYLNLSAATVISGSSTDVSSHMAYTYSVDSSTLANICSVSASGVVTLIQNAGACIIDVSASDTTDGDYKTSSATITLNVWLEPTITTFKFVGQTLSQHTYATAYQTINGTQVALDWDYSGSGTNGSYANITTASDTTDPALDSLSGLYGYSGNSKITTETGTTNLLIPALGTNSAPEYTVYELTVTNPAGFTTAPVKLYVQAAPGTWVAVGTPSDVTNALGVNPLSAMLLSQNVWLGGGEVSPTSNQYDDIYREGSGQNLGGEWFYDGSDMISAHQNGTATLLADGTVLLAGGDNGNGTVNGILEIYTPSTLGTPGAGLYTQVVNGSSQNLYIGGTTAQPTTGHTATLLANGQVLIAGGWDGTTNYSYPANTNLWLYDPIKKTVSPSSQYLDVAVHGATATALTDGTGRVVILGGIDPSGNPSNRMCIYTPAMNGGAESMNCESMDTGHANHTATLLPDGIHVLVAGGSTTSTPVSSELVVIAPNNDVPGYFSVLTGSLATAREHHSAVLLGDNQSVLVFGGDDGTNTLSSTEIIEPATCATTTVNCSISTEPMNYAREQAASMLLADGAVFAAGGESDTSGTNTDTAEVDSLLTYTGTGITSVTTSNYSAPVLGNGGKVDLSGGDVVYLSPKNYIDAGDTNGKASVTVASGNGPFRYIWTISNGTITSGLGVTTNAGKTSSIVFTAPTTPSDTVPFTITALVVDAFGMPVQNSVNVYVKPAITSPPVVTVFSTGGTQDKVNAGDAGSYAFCDSAFTSGWTYHWSVSNANATLASALTTATNKVNLTPGTAGNTFTVSCYITDGVGTGSLGTSDLVTIQAAPLPSFTSAPAFVEAYKTGYSITLSDTNTTSDTLGFDCGASVPAVTPATGTFSTNSQALTFSAPTNTGTQLGDAYNAHLSCKVWDETTGQTEADAVSTTADITSYPFQSVTVTPQDAFTGPNGTLTPSISEPGANDVQFHLTGTWCSAFTGSVCTLAGTDAHDLTADSLTSWSITAGTATAGTTKGLVYPDYFNGTAYTAAPGTSTVQGTWNGHSATSTLTVGSWVAINDLGYATSPTHAAEARFAPLSAVGFQGKFWIGGGASDVAQDSINLDATVFPNLTGAAATYPFGYAETAKWVNSSNLSATGHLFGTATYDPTHSAFEGGMLVVGGTTPASGIEIFNYAGAYQFDDSLSLITSGNPYAFGSTATGLTGYTTLPDTYFGQQAVFLTLGNNANNVLLVGGADISSASVVAQGIGGRFNYLYAPENTDQDPAASGLSTSSCQLSDGHIFGSATTLGDNRVLILGGFNSATTVTGVADLYYPETVSGVAAADNCLSLSALFAAIPLSPAAGTSTTLATPRALHTATQLNDTNGRVLIAGGVTNGTINAMTGMPDGTATASMEIFDPTLNGNEGGFIQSEHSVPLTMKVARKNHAAVLLGNGMVLIYGGTDNTGTTLNSAEVYNPTWYTDGWSTPTMTVGNMATARAWFASALLETGSFHAVAAGGAAQSGAGVSAAEVFTTTPHQ
jgi:hypothetical protein